MYTPNLKRPVGLGQSSLHSNELGNLIMGSFERNEKKIALVNSGGELSYEALSHLVSGICNLASDKQIQNEDVIIYFGADSNELYATLLASCLGNFKMLVLHERTPVEIVRRHIAFLDTKLVITEGEIDLGVPTFSRENIVPSRTDPGVSRSTISHLTSTSGSLGFPKLIGVDSIGLSEFLDWARRSMNLSPEHIWTECGDYTSDMWINNALMALTSGSRIYFKSQKNPLQSYAQLLESSATHFRSVPQISKFLTAGRKRSLQDVTSLKFVGLGGDVVHHSTLVEMNAWLPQEAELHTTYGCAEVAGFSLTHKIDRASLSAQSDKIIHSLGYPIKGTQLKILQRDANASGELQIHSKQVCVEWMDTNCGDKEFRQIKEPGDVAAYNTGDIVTRTDSSVLYRGRKGREIVRNGSRIQLEAVEKLLTDKLGSQGVIIDRNGDLFLLLETSRQISLAEMNLAVDGEIPSFAYPTKIIEVELLPRNSRGKIDYATCRSLTTSVEN